MQNKKPIPVVAIDGPVGVGKSSVAHNVAAKLGFQYIDTGAMYRTVVLLALETSANPTASTLIECAEKLAVTFSPAGEAFMNGASLENRIRQESISREVYRAADLPAVREILVQKQQQLGAASPSVMEGRDITTVVFPEASWQFYLDADPEIRARRRFDQLVKKNQPQPFESVLQNLWERDNRDRNRPTGALKISENATVFDTSYLSEEQVVAIITAVVRDSVSAAAR